MTQVTCVWCNNALPANDTVNILCQDCITIRNEKRAAMDRDKAARDAEAARTRWNPLAPLIIKETREVLPGKRTYVHCPGCHQVVETTSEEVRCNCPTCNTKLQIRQPREPVIEPPTDTKKLPEQYKTPARIAARNAVKKAKDAQSTKGTR